LAAPVVRQPASAFTGQSRRDPDDFIAGDPRPVRSEVLPNAPRFDISSGQMSANLVFAPRPEYPALARMAHIQGDVVLKADIAADGSVSATHILNGHRLLRGAAVAAVRRWRYRPFVANGRPVDITTIVTVGFHANR
jgi:protein TonB